MIDFVKVRINTRGTAEQLRKDPFFDFRANDVNADTGEDHSGQRTATVRNLEITLYESGLVEVTGSLHKYANDGHHNHDQFTFERLCQTVREVSDLLHVPPDLLSLHNVEFGVNVALPMLPSQFLDSILNYRFKLPDVRTFSGRGHLKQWVHQNYIVKVYDKKRQYRLSANILRFEVKVMAMAHLECVEVRTMADLLDKGKLAVLGGLLSKTYDGLMIGEKLHTGQMTAPERRIYEKGMNPNFWRDLPNRKQRTYYRTKFEQLVSRHGGLMRETVGQLISGRVDFLLKSWDVLPLHIHS